MFSQFFRSGSAFKQSAKDVWRIQVKGGNFNKLNASIRTSLSSCNKNSLIHNSCLYFVNIYF